MYDELREDQADLTRLLLRYVQAPLVNDTVIRGVLPAPSPARAVRVATGAASDYRPERFTAYEFPLGPDDDPITAPTVLGLLATLVVGTHHYPGSQVSIVMGMAVVRVDLAKTEPSPLPPDHDLMTILSLTAQPFTGERIEPLLCGFLLLAPDRLRLYLHTSDTPGITAADVRPDGAVTALLAALPSLVHEQERARPDGTDPHCDRRMDLTDW
jgi:hypothetical protein